MRDPCINNGDLASSFSLGIGLLFSNFERRKKCFSSSSSTGMESGQEKGKTGEKPLKRKGQD
jgi:hypothetical protein